MIRKTDDTIILQMLEDGKQQKEIAEYFGVSPAAICKRVARLSAYPKTLKELTPKEQRFAVSVANGMSQTKAAIDSYEVSSMRSAKALGSQLMKKPKIDAAISELMEYHGMGRHYRVAKLKAHLDHPDPVISLKSLEMSFKADGTFRENHLHVAMTREDFEEIQVARQSAEEASEQARERAEARRQELIELQEQAKAQGIELPPELATIPDLD